MEKILKAFAITLIDGIIGPILAMSVVLLIAMWLLTIFGLVLIPEALKSGHTWYVYFICIVDFLFLLYLLINSVMKNYKRL